VLQKLLGIFLLLIAGTKIVNTISVIQLEEWDEIKAHGIAGSSEPIAVSPVDRRVWSISKMLTGKHLFLLNF
jgi:hypothetical protein